MINFHVVNDIINCKLCELHKNCKVSPALMLLPENYSSDILIVVRSPNKEAELIGEPVDLHEYECIKRLGLGNYPVTAIIKCPTESSVRVHSVDSCGRHLLAEINELKPNKILVFGKQVSKWLDRLDIKYIELPSIHSIMNLGAAKFREIYQQIESIKND